MKQMNMRKNGKMTVGMLLLFLCIVLAVLVPVLAPWSSTEMHADIRSQGMSFSVSYTHLTLPTTRHQCRSRWSPYH